MKKILLLILVFATLHVHAQTQFIQSGKIEFEKKLNIYKEIEGETFLDNFKDKIPKFQTSYFNLYFKDGKTLYEKGKDSDVKVGDLAKQKVCEIVRFARLEKGEGLQKKEEK